MKVICLPVGELATNCYLAADENGAAAVIDPGDAAQEILARAAQEKLTIAAVLLTHAHFDHMPEKSGRRPARRCMCMPTISRRSPTRYAA